jgi:hypothetical protein
MAQRRANRGRIYLLAKLCLKFAMASLQPGFHIHLREDFSGDSAQPDHLRLGIVDSEQ